MAEEIEQPVIELPVCEEGEEAWPTDFGYVCGPADEANPGGEEAPSPSPTPSPEITQPGFVVPGDVHPLPTPEESTPEEMTPIPVEDTVAVVQQPVEYVPLLAETGSDDVFGYIFIGALMIAIGWFVTANAGRNRNVQDDES